MGGRRGQDGWMVAEATDRPRRPAAWEAPVVFDILIHGTVYKPKKGVSAKTPLPSLGRLAMCRGGCENPLGPSPCGGP